MKKMHWTCADCGGKWNTTVPDCFQYNGADVFCVFCSVDRNFAQAMAAAMSAPYATL